MRPRGSRDTLEKRRITAVNLLHKGWTQEHVAKKLGCSRKSVQRWQQSFNQSGWAGLKAKHSTGRPAKLNPDVARKILRSLSPGQKSALQVAEGIRKQSGVTYHRRYIRRLVKRLGVTLCFLLCFPNVSRAVGVTGASFLRTEQSARVVGMGGAFVAFADDGDAIYWNPGGLGFIDTRSLRLTHHQGFIDLREEFLSAIQPFGKAGTLGINLLYSTIADVNIYDDFGIIVDQAENYDFVADVAWGSKIRGQTGIGLGAKVFISRLAEIQADGIAFDFGFITHLAILKGSSVGLALQNVGPGITYISETDPLPINFRTGFAYQGLFAANHSIRAAFEVSRIVYKQELFYPTIGLEYDFRKNYFLRAGYRFNRFKDKFSFGFGLSSSGFQLDYAFLPFGALGGSHRFTLTLNLGVPPRPKETIAPIAKPIPQATPEVPPTLIPPPEPTTPQARYEYKFQLPGNSLFLSGDAALSEDGKLALEDTLDILQKRYLGSHILIAGYTDNRPPRSSSPFSSNYELSLARAEAVQNLFVQLGHPEKRISVVGFGESRPRGSNETAQGRSSNRRVDIFVFEKKKQMVNDLIQESVNLIGEDKLKPAVHVLLQIVELDPTNSGVFRALGICYYRLGNTEGSMRVFQKALLLSPGDEELVHWLNALRKRQEIISLDDLNDENIPLTQSVVEHSETLQSAVDLLRIHKAKEALVILTALSKKQPRDPRIYMYTGLALKFLNKNDQARKFFEVTINMVPEKSKIRELTQGYLDELP